MYIYVLLYLTGFNVCEVNNVFRLLETLGFLCFNNGARGVLYSRKYPKTTNDL
jgi:hypothetical protein